MVGTSAFKMDALFLTTNIPSKPHVKLAWIPNTSQGKEKQFGLEGQVSKVSVNLQSPEAVVLNLRTEALSHSSCSDPQAYNLLLLHICNFAVMNWKSDVTHRLRTIE